MQANKGKSACDNALKVIAEDLKNLKLTCPGSLVPFSTYEGAGDERREYETDKPGCDNDVKSIANDLKNLKLTCPDTFSPFGTSNEEERL